MLKLTLAAKQGNGVRYFPYAGYLRMTPLKIEGIVRTRIDEDNRPLLCSGLYVALRCYEARLGLGLGLGLGGASGSSTTSATTVDNGNPNLNVLFEIIVPLWNASAAASEYDSLGDGEWPFKIIVPPNASPVCSTVHFQEYRVFWRVEAVLTHVPITGVGVRLVKTQDIPLIRYDSGQDLPPQPPNKWRKVSLPSHPRSPSILKYIINTPPFPLAPLDYVPVTLKLALPQGIDVVSIALSIERRLTFKSSHDAVYDDVSFQSTTNLIQPRLASQPSSKASSTTVLTSVTHTIATSDRKPEDVSYNRTITLQIPQAKSLSHWSLGETIHTPLASVRFFLKTRITIVDSQLNEGQTSTSRPPSPPIQPQPSTSSSVPNSSQTQSRSYTLDLQEKELYVISTNEADRREAFTKYRDALRRGRKRKVTSPGKEKESAIPPMSASDAVSTSDPLSETPSTLERDSSTARGRSPSQSIFKPKSKSKSKSHSRKDKENLQDTRQQQAGSKGKQKDNKREETDDNVQHLPSSPPSPVDEPPRPLKKTTKRPNTSEGRTNIEMSTEESSSSLKVKSSKEKKPTNRGSGLTLGLGLLTPRSRRFRRQCRASDGDGDIENDVDDYDGEYVFVNNNIPLSAPPIRRLSRRNPHSPYSRSPSSPYETSADEGARVVVYLQQDGTRDTDKAIVTNASTGTSTSEGTEENAGPPTPPDEPPFTTQLHDRKTLPLHLSVHPPSSYHPIPELLPSSRSWTALPHPPSSALLRSSTTPAPRSPSAPVRADDKERWEIELERMIQVSKEEKEERGVATTKTKTKKSSTMTAIGFRKKNKKTAKIPDSDATALSLSPTSCSEFEGQAQSPIHLSPTSPSSLSPVYIPHSPSTPALPVSATTKPKPTSKFKTKTFGIGWGFGWS
ncbi:hypothetical protein Clacol_006184 [Clathrus columnatus]|uniref:Arrestin C-terminal-like domain-containing protein n=1 Tax=Clathrus columnatus TaxID=1419009 RepID=A0AAV5AHI5_9AGAM|nr:hypothetical protein Clacol_006184 [Clathrus columnatus]